MVAAVVLVAVAAAALEAVVAVVVEEEEVMTVGVELLGIGALTLADREPELVLVLGPVVDCFFAAGTSSPFRGDRK